MRYVPGGDVNALLHREGPLPSARVAAIVSPVASALDAAHGAGLVHRDVKPTNMLLDVRPGRPDHVYLSDFGLSKVVLSSATITALGEFLGTPDYVAPEQIKGDPVDGQADQYALACAAFEMLAGQPPFHRDVFTAVLWAHMSEPPPPLSALRPDLPAEADRVFARAMAKAPEDRYPRCADFAESLRRALGLPPYDLGVISEAQQSAAEAAAPSIPTEPSRAIPAPALTAWPAQPSLTMPPTGLPRPPTAGGSGDRPKPVTGPASRRRLTAVGVVAAVAVVYLAVAAVAHAFPFTEPHHGPQTQPTHPVTPSQVTRIVPLTELLPSDMSTSTCSQSNPADYNFKIPATAQALECQQGNWSATAVQTDTSAHYLTAWQNFKNWAGINSASAGTNCPPQNGSSQGIVPWSNKYFPQREGQTLVCWTYISGGSPFPSYAWSFPTEHAFIWARGQVHTSFSSLDTWWRTNETQTASPTPSPS
jgi:hypothetical protein